MTDSHSDARDEPARLSSSTPTLSVVLPTFNEAGNLPGVFQQIAQFARTSGTSVELIVVDDASADGTGVIAESLVEQFAPFVRAQVVHRPRKLGLSGALYDGMRQSTGRWVAMLDADNSHDITCLHAMVPAARAGADVVIGSRYTVGGRIERWPFHRRIFSFGATFLARTMFGIVARDPVSGFAIITRQVIERFPGPSNPRASKLLLEMLVKVRPERVVEVPITFRDRATGQSKFAVADLVEFSRLVRALLREARRGSPQTPSLAVTPVGHSHATREQPDLQ